MAQYKGLNPIVRNLRGRIGGILVFREMNGHTVVSARPEGRKNITGRQKEQVDRFTGAALYAKAQMNDAFARAEYEKGKTPNKNTAYRVALTDYLNPPVIHSVKVRDYKGHAGEIIQIRATDDFMVTLVNVEVISGTGDVVEKGVATQDRRQPDRWRYRTTTSNPAATGTVIRVCAYDRPGNIATFEWSKPSRNPGPTPSSTR